MVSTHWSIAESPRWRELVDAVLRLDPAAAGRLVEVLAPVLRRQDVPDWAAEGVIAALRCELMLEPSREARQAHGLVRRTFVPWFLLQHLDTAPDATSQLDRWAAKAAQRYRERFPGTSERRDRTERPALSVVAPIRPQAVDPEFGDEPWDGRATVGLHTARATSNTFTEKPDWFHAPGRLIDAVWDADEPPAGLAVYRPALAVYVAFNSDGERAPLKRLLEQSEVGRAAKKHPLERIPAAPWPELDELQVAIDDDLQLTREQDALGRAVLAMGILMVRGHDLADHPQLGLVAALRRARAVQRVAIVLVDHVFRIGESRAYGRTAQAAAVLDAWGYGAKSNSFGGARKELHHLVAAALAAPRRSP